MEKTYGKGFSLKCNNIITKNDIINFCKLLNEKNEYKDKCEFKPEGISEGGIVFKFNNSENKWYKSVRLCLNEYDDGRNRNGEWYWINDNVMDEWSDNNDIILKKNSKFHIFLKSFHGAPVFTLDELKIWEDCFNKIGISKTGKFPNMRKINIKI
jgi:hypothetical protein